MDLKTIGNLMKSGGKPELFILEMISTLDDFAYSPQTELSTEIMVKIDTILKLVIIKAEAEKERPEKERKFTLIKQYQPFFPRVLKYFIKWLDNLQEGYEIVSDDKKGVVWGIKK